MEEHRVPDVRKTPERRQQEIGRAGYVEQMKREGREDLIPRDWDPDGKGHPAHKREHDIRAAVHTTLNCRYPATDDRRYAGASITALFDLLQRKRNKR